MGRIMPLFRTPPWFWPGILLLAGFGLSCFGQAPITNGLVARWTGDGNAKDSAGHDDGKISGGLSYVEGQTGQAFQFNGTDAAIDFGPNAGNFGTRDFTVAYWMKSSSAKHVECFLAKRSTCDGAAVFREINVGGRPTSPGCVELVMANGGFQSATGLVASWPLNDGVWHHLAWVRQSTSSGGTAFLLYVDGIFDNSTNYFVDGRRDTGANAIMTTDLDSARPLVMGKNVCQCCDGRLPYSGAAAELQLFSHALSAEEIFTIYKAGKTGK